MQIIAASTIVEFQPAEWNRLFPGELEDWYYYRATERAGLPEFEWLYLGVRVDGELRAAVPAFITDYRLDTTLDGALRSAVGTLARVMPGLLRPRVLALGSPVAETCHAGFAPDCPPAERGALLEKILEACEAHAARHDVRMLAVKDPAEADSTLWNKVLSANGMRRQPGLATASLALPHADLDAYLATLSRATRKDLRRKQRTRRLVRIEWRRDLDGIADEVMRLYRNTLERARMQFEQLTPAWFQHVLAELKERAWCVCYWFGDRLVAFNLVLKDHDRLIDKYIGMDYRHARELNLYFLSWTENVRHAIEHGIPVYLSGQGLPNEKRRLGCTLSPNWLWYRHRNGIVDGTMKVAEHALGLHRQSESAEPMLRGEVRA